jgi:integrase
MTKLALTAKTLEGIRVGRINFAGRIWAGNGRFAEISDKGTISFALKYRRDGKERREGLGRWPDVSIDEAVRKAVNFDREATGGRAASSTFKEAADDWLTLNRDNLAERTVTQVERYLNACSDEFGAKELRRVKPSDVLAVLRKFERRGKYETAKRTRIYAHKVFAWAMDPDDDLPNPASLERLKDKLSRSPDPKHHASMPAAQIPDFLRSLAADNVHPSVRGALSLVIYTGLRTGEVRGLLWSDVKADLSALTIPKERMKAREPHTVFLSTQARAVLEAVKPFSERRGHVFPGRDPRYPLSDMAMLSYMVRKAPGYTVHGFRSSLSTWANSKRGGAALPVVVERCLAHTSADKVAAAYNHHDYDDEAAELWQKWADAISPT